MDIIGNRFTEQSAIGMTTKPFDFIVPVVDEKPLLRIHAKGSEPKLCGIFIQHNAV